LSVKICPLNKIFKTEHVHFSSEYTNILSRLAEKLIVQKWLLPVVDHQTINDHSAFRPILAVLRVPWYFHASCHYGYLKLILPSLATY